MPRQGLLCAFFAAWLLVASAGPGFAAGTPAGSVITNRATVVYTVGGLSLSVSSNTVSVVVAEILDVTATWQDAASVNVFAGDTDRVLTFLVTNTGNGTDRYSLSVNGSLAGDDFDPVPAGIYLDSNGNGTYDPGTDVQYSAGANDPLLAADQSLAVFVLSDIPSDIGAGDIGSVMLSSVSIDGGGMAAGAVIPGGGDGGVDAVVGSSGARASATGSYVASVVVATKSSLVADPYGGSRVIPGAVITYTIVVSVSGAGATASGVTVEDPVPANTTYVPGSLTLNGVGLTDASDGDPGDVGQTTPGTVTVCLGDLTSASPAQTITFRATVNSGP